MLMIILTLLLNLIPSESRSIQDDDIKQIEAVFGPKKKKLQDDEINSSVSMVSDSDDGKGQITKVFEDTKSRKKASSYLKDNDLMGLEDSDHRNKTKSDNDSGSDEIPDSFMNRKKHSNENNRKNRHEQEEGKGMPYSERLKRCRIKNKRLLKRLKKMYETQSSVARSKSNVLAEYHKNGENENKFGTISSDSEEDNKENRQKKGANKAKRSSRDSKKYPKNRGKKARNHDDSEISEFE